VLDAPAAIASAKFSPVSTFTVVFKLFVVNKWKIPTQVNLF
jgi:hypothetical protein